MKNLFPRILVPYALLPWLVAALCGCGEEKRAKTLGENEYYLGERLASLSADADSTFWIGGETGRIWHVDGDRVIRYSTGTDRVYKVSTHPDGQGDTVCWLGVRNSGLQQWVLRDGRMEHRQTCEIPIKHSNYSAYDFVMTPQGIFTATSQGLYLLRPDGLFRLLYPSQSSLTATEGLPFIVYNLCFLGGRYLYAASIGGLLRVDLATLAVALFHQGENIQHVAAYDGNLYAIADKTLYEDNGQGETLRKVTLDFTPHIYYKVDKVHYLLRNHSIVVSEDLKTFFNIPLRRDVPLNCRNVMLPDERAGFTMLVTENAFWRIPFHSSFFNNKGMVISACANSHEAYYLNSQNELFREPASDSVATKIFTLPQDEQVTKMAVTDNGQLYYVNGRSELRTVAVGGSNLRNEVFSRIRTLYHSKERITALHVVPGGKAPKVYVGVQDGLVVIDGNGVADTVGTLADRHITAFASLPGAEGVYMSTMDAGIVYGNRDGYRTIPQSEHMTFIRDLFVTDGYPPSLTVLTNHALVMPGNEDTIALSGSNRLIAMSDSLFYVVPEFGIRRYAVSGRRMQPTGRFFDDIHFHAQSSFRLGDALCMVSEVGVLRLVPGREHQPVDVAFDTRVLTLNMVLAGLLGLLLLVGLVGWLHWHRRSEQRRQVSLRIRDLSERMQGMSSMATLLSADERQHVARLLQEVASISAEETDVNQRISHLSEQIMHKNRDWALQLSKVLEAQVREISVLDAYDCANLIESSRMVLAQDSMQQICDRIMENKAWLQQYALLNRNIRKYASCVEGCLLVEGVNSQFQQMVEHLRQSLCNRPLADMQAEMEAAEAAYQAVFSDSSRQRILETLISFGERISLMEADAVRQALQEEMGRLQDATGSPVEMLREMKPVESRIVQLELRKQLQEEMRRYRQIREHVTSENNKRVNKKFDMKLEEEIADNTQAETDWIERLVAEFYRHFTYTDGEAVSRVLGTANYASQQARVLALLMADSKVKRLLLPGMLGMYGNLNPVVSRLVNNRIKPNEEWLQAYAARHPASMVSYVLRLSL